MSSIENEIFVLYSNTGGGVYYNARKAKRRGYHDQSSLLQIGVYTASTFETERHIQINCTMSGDVYRTNSSQNAYALAACSNNKCLYVSDKNDCVVHNVNVRAKETTPISQWSVESPPYGLSTNSVHNVLVACGDDCMFLEYTTYGLLVRKINLRPHIEYPVQVVQLFSGRYGIIHQGSTPGYSVVDDNGQVINRYTKPGILVSDIDSKRFLRRRQTDVLRTHCTLAVVHPRKVSQINNRILVLTETENSFTDEWLPQGICGALNQPSCIHYDASRRRLYIGEYDSGRVLCCGP